jgi:hypothetical protein
VYRSPGFAQESPDFAQESFGLAQEYCGLGLGNSGLAQKSGVSLIKIRKFSCIAPLVQKRGSYKAVALLGTAVLLFNSV